MGSKDFLVAAAGLQQHLAGSSKSVEIQIAPGDLTFLKLNDYKLCFAKKVGDNAFNVVWQSYTKYLSTSTFSWTPQYQLFGSNTFHANVEVVVSTNRQTIGLGQQCTLASSGLLGPASTSPPPPNQSLTLINDFGPIHPGVSQISTSTITGETVVTPIYVANKQIATGTDVLTPKDFVMVWFEQDIETSTMFGEARSNPVVIDLTEASSGTRLYQNGAWTTPA